jgi:hypothetical protein
MREKGKRWERRQRTLSWIEPNGSLTKLSGSSSAVERQLPKLDVTGSIPVSRSTLHAELKNKKRPLPPAKVVAEVYLLHLLAEASQD